MFGRNYQKELAKIQVLEHEKKAKAAAAQAAAEKKRAQASANERRQTELAALKISNPVAYYVRLGAGLGLVALACWGVALIFQAFTPAPLTPEQESAKAQYQTAVTQGENLRKTQDEAVRQAGNLLYRDAKAQMRDPDSAKFTGLYLTQDLGTLCGYVNAKNGFGGYTGKEAFLYGRVSGMLLGYSAYKQCEKERPTSNDMHLWNDK